MSAVVDALVIGGGPAGAGTAVLLARAGWQVLVVERQRFPRRKVCGEYLSGSNLALLERLGVGATFRAEAGPEVTHVGLFHADTSLAAPLPRPADGWGRALSRERLDTLLLASAVAAGAATREATTVVGLAQTPDGLRARLESGASSPSEEVEARLVVAAHGSWEPGTLPTQPARPAPRGSDLLGFKAHFLRANLRPGLMPLLVFPGGYGGMVHAEAGRVSLSCCVRRDALPGLRAEAPGEAGEAVLAHLVRSGRGVREALEGAERSGAWLAAGPIRPGVRLGRPCMEGVFRVGNAAGEAHPAVAEGISMALQGAWLLARRLVAWRAQGADRARLGDVERDHARAWVRHLAPRVRASRLLAWWALSPAAVSLGVPLARRWPRLLTWAARRTGKTRPVPR